MKIERWSEKHWDVPCGEWQGGMGADRGADVLFAVWAIPHLIAPTEAGSEDYQLREVKGVWRLEVGEGMRGEVILQSGD